MSIYGSISNNVVEESITDEEFGRYFSEAVMDLFMEDCFEESNEDVLEEGANVDMTNIFKDSKKKFKAAMKESKGYIKSKDYANAKKSLNEAKSIASKMYKDIQSTHSTFGSAMWGYLCMLILNWYELLFTNAIALVGNKAFQFGLSATNFSLMKKGLVLTGLGSLGSFIKSIIILIKDIKEIIERSKSSKENIYDITNLYKNKLMRYSKDMEKQIDKLIKEVEKKEKEDK